MTRCIQRVYAAIGRFFLCAQNLELFFLQDDALWEALFTACELEQIAHRELCNLLVHFHAFDEAVKLVNKTVSVRIVITIS